MSNKKSAKKNALMQNDGYSLPNFDDIVENNPNYKMNLINALNYAAYVFNNKDRKEFANMYAQDKLDLSLSNVPDWELVHVGPICWLLHNDCYVEGLERYVNKIKELYNKYNKATKSDNTEKVDLQQLRTDDLIAELEGMLDDVVLKRDNITNPIELYRYAAPFKENVVKTHFENQLKDIQSGGEGYEELNAETLKRVTVALQFILKQLNDFQNEKSEKKTKKTVRKAKQKKIVPTKMVSKLKYKKSDDEYNIKSIHASKIVTADVLWVFNTKTRNITQYVAADKVGLLVKGTTIKNIDPEKSKEKKLRKPEEFLKKLQKSGKVEQRTLLDDINAKEKIPNGRINEHCILYKIY